MNNTYIKLLVRIYASNVVYRRQRYIDGLPDKQKRYLAKYRKRLDAMLRCIDENDQLVQQIIDNVECLFENKPPYSLDSVSVSHSILNFPLVHLLFHLFLE